MDHLRRRLKEWVIAKAESKTGTFWLILFSFAESSFFPIPPDFLLIAILLAKQERRWFFYSLITTIASVLGGLFGYLIGFAFFEFAGQKLIDLYNLQDKVDYVAGLFQQNAFFTILVAAFTPIPYKVFTISAGLFSISLPIFIIASIIGRGGRFFAVGLALRFWGPQIAHLLYKYFNFFSIIAVIIIGLLIYFVF
ncbi:MAG TPA: VTT domain-containing protein [Candidatus Paceibacterota bacterium]|nr:VTT domain-containing protein [Candidatus Paceibacterota bacterium]